MPSTSVGGISVGRGARVPSNQLDARRVCRGGRRDSVNFLPALPLLVTQLPTEDRATEGDATRWRTRGPVIPLGGGRQVL